ncbi:MAG: hypothetical protein M5R42_05815 [Rhodocyclaceae bacterium]|nr:hypothetical protein [Rhodocyclaceae bacterium]
MTRSTRSLAAFALCVLGASAFAEPGPLASYDPPLDPAFAKLIANADLKAGARYFERKCSQCHDAEKAAATSRARTCGTSWAAWPPRAKASASLRR